MNLKNQSPLETLPPPSRLKAGRQIIYATGNLGWATLLHIIYSFMVYFYIPPKKANLPNLLTDFKLFGILNIIVLVAAMGRIIEAITDPLIAGISDRTTSKYGRRIPFMLIGFLPASIFCALIFLPPHNTQSITNLYWVVVMQLLFYPFFSMYSIPHYALMVELSHTEKDKINISTFTSLAYALSSLTSAFVPVIATQLQKLNGIERLPAIQTSIIILCIFSAVCMLLPILFISEKKYSLGYPGRPTALIQHQPVFQSLKLTFKNSEFRKFVFSDCFYWTGLNMVSTGMLYYITVLLELKDDMLMTFMIVLIVSSFSIYPLVNKVAKIYSRKKLIELAFIVFSIVFLLVFFLGRIPLPAKLQATILVILASIPFAFLGILPNTILADIAEFDALENGSRREGMFFAARTMIMKLGQTFGIIIFTVLLQFGKDPGNDLGVRLSGVCGFILCLIATFIFHQYDESKILKKIKK